MHVPMSRSTSAHPAADRADRPGVTAAPPRSLARCQVDVGIRRPYRPAPVVHRGPGRRQQPRLTLHILGEARGAGRHLVGWILDLSQDGLFLRSADPLPRGSRASLDFFLPEGGGIIRCQAVATAALPPSALGPGGNRFHITVMRPAYRDRLDAWVRSRLVRHVARSEEAEVEVSLIGQDLRLEELCALPSTDPEATGIDALPEVGGLLEEVQGEGAFEPWNDVGAISPDDMVLVA